ncbi:hypothetical protein Tco_0480494 [Tanacetum coccineum]
MMPSSAILSSFYERNVILNKAFYEEEKKVIEWIWSTSDIWECYTKTMRAIQTQALDVAPVKKVKKSNKGVQVEVAEQVGVEDLVGGVEDLVGGVEEEVGLVT